MEKAVRVDEKGRVRIPKDFAEDMGESIMIRKTSEGLLLLPVDKSEEEDFLTTFRRVITSEPERTGKPRNPPPARMKRIWKERVG